MSLLIFGFVLHLAAGEIISGGGAELFFPLGRMGGSDGATDGGKGDEKEEANAGLRLGLDLVEGSRRHLVLLIGSGYWCEACL